MKKTPWFPASIDPHRVGWYEYRTFRSIHLDIYSKPITQAWFDGWEWWMTAYFRYHMYSGCEGSILAYKITPSSLDTWRGLAEKPE